MVAKMRRLINADDVKELLLGLDSLPWEEQVDELVDRIPTAYDVEAVVRELEKQKIDLDQPNVVAYANAKGWNQAISLCIDIVKRGGRNE